MPVAEVNGVKLYYEEKGTGDQVIIALPGFGASAKITLRTLEPLTECCRVIAMDIRGHGKSAQITEGWTLSQLADDVYRFSRWLGLGKFVCLGESMGGSITLRLALDHPEAIKKIVLVSSVPACGATTPKEILEQALANTDNNKETTIAMTRSLFIKPVTEEMKGLIEDLTVDALSVSDEVRRAWLLKEQYYNWEDQMKNIKIPALVIYGEKDPICIPEAQHNMAVLLADAKECVIPDTGHFMMCEAPELAFQEICAFINQ